MQDRDVTTAGLQQLLVKGHGHHLRRTAYRSSKPQEPQENIRLVLLDGIISVNYVFVLSCSVIDLGYRNSMEF